MQRFLNPVEALEVEHLTERDYGEKLVKRLVLHWSLSCCIREITGIKGFISLHSAETCL